MAKRQKKDSSVEQAVLAAVGEVTVKGRGKRTLTRFECKHVGTELGVKAKAFVRFAEARNHLVEDDLTKKCPDCK